MKSALKKEKGKVDLFGERYRARAHHLSPRLRAVVSYINDNREVVLEHTAMEIATATQTSDATVVRAIQALGFAGLRELKQTMERWFGTSVTSAEKMRSTVTALSSDVNSSIDFVLEGHQRVCEVLSRADNRAAVAQAVALLSDARQVGIFGIGASGILAEYTARLFSRIGLPAYVMNRTGFSLAEQLIGLQRGDVLIMMGQKSPHREGLTTLREAKRLGIPTILLTQAVDSRFSQEAQVVIDVPRGGDSSRMPLHGTVLVCLEMIVLSVASTTPQKTVKSLKRINDLSVNPAVNGAIEKIIHQREGFRLHIKVSVCIFMQNKCIKRKSHGQEFAQSVLHDSRADGCRTGGCGNLYRRLRRHLPAV